MGVRKEHPGLKNKENDENSGPTTTVFVGNISEKASDMLIRQLLAVSNITVSELSPAELNSDILTSVLLYLLHWPRFKLATYGISFPCRIFHLSFIW